MRTEDRDAIMEAAKAAGLDPQVMLCVALVESRGVAFHKVDGKDMPAILFEPHIFWRQLPPNKRAAAVKAGLASKTRKLIPYAKTVAANYERLRRAMEIDVEAAYASCSWGIGQVMGFNARRIGYRSAESMALACMKGVGGQADAMARFLVAEGLQSFMAARDWLGFAVRYNGSAHAENNYVGKLEAEWRKLTGEKSPVVLRLGDRGPDVRKLQEALKSFGALTGPLDGVFGPDTEKAVKTVQASAGLKVDGMVGARTWAYVEKRVGAPVAAAQPSAVAANADAMAGVGKTVAAVTGAATPVLALWKDAKAAVDEAAAMVGLDAGLVLAGLGLAVVAVWLAPRVIALMDRRRTA